MATYHLMMSRYIHCFDIQFLIYILYFGEIFSYFASSWKWYSLTFWIGKRQDCSDGFFQYSQCNLSLFQIYNNYSMSLSWIWSDKITNEHVVRVGYNHFISNKGEWNNCFSKFSNQVLPPIFICTILQSVRKAKNF